MIREIGRVLWGAHDGYGYVKAYDLANIPSLHHVDQVENPMHSTDACSSCLARLVSIPQGDLFDSVKNSESMIIYDCTQVRRLWQNYKMRLN